MNKAQIKTEQIFQTTLEILRESGGHGLSMRGVAERAGMSLSNLQYYFKNRDVLLAALLEYFLDSCAEDAAARLAGLSGRPRDKIKQMLVHSLSDDSLDEWYIIFKELWAAAARNDSMKATLDAYYRDCFDRTIELLKTVAPQGTSRATLRRAASLLVPYVEGYQVAAGGLPGRPAETAELLTGLVMELLESG